MANNNNPHGLRSLGVTLSGGAPVLEVFSKVVGYGTAIFRGDAVNRVADASIEASATPGTTAYSGVSLNYGAASTATDHVCVIDPFALFEAQSNGSLVAADMGLNANLTLGAGSTSTKLSGHQIDASTKATTATLDVHLLRSLRVPENDITSNYARIEVIFNKHRMQSGVAGV